MSGKLRFDGKVAVVTGAGGGLGRSYALAFADRGAKVVVNDLGGNFKGEGKGSNMADQVVNEIKSRGGQAVANYDSVEDGAKIIQTALDNYGRVDILVNNAGILRDRSFARTSDLDWDLVHRVHLRGSFMVTRAAWEHMKKNNYGRIIMTTSSSGIYGNFGQANYSAAKMGLVGLSNTLAIEGRKYNISCNAVGPIAGSRMTETVMPQDVVEAMKPDYVMPIVLWLCHDDCESTGGIFECGGGYASQTQIMQSKGVLVRKRNQEMTPEQVRDNWEGICDFTEFDTPKSSAESGGKPHMALMELSKSDGVGPNKTSAKIRMNPTSEVTPEAAIGHVLSPGSFSYKPRDACLYAQGIGMGTQHKDFLRFLFELREDFTCMPTYGAIIGMSGMNGLMSGDLPVSINPTQILHGEQYLEIFKPLGPDGNFTCTAKIVDVLDKGRGAVFVVEVETFNESGERVLRNQSSTYVQQMGNYGGKRKSTVAVEPVDHPKRAPDASIQEQTSINQAALYRLSGDYNPLHIDPDFAAMGGFDRPILHGLCTFGYSGRHVLQQYCDNDPSKFKAIKVRFSKPVLPGQTLRTDMWKEGSRIHFTTTVVENGNVCLTGAYVDIVDSGASQQEEEDSGRLDLQSDIIFLGIEDRLKDKPELVKQVKAILGWNITQGGKTVKTWTVDLKNAPGAVYQGPPKKGKADVNVTISDENMMDIVTEKINGQEAFFSGKLKVTGNVMLGLKLQNIFKDEKSKL